VQGSIGDPILVLVGDVAKHVSAHGIGLPKVPEEVHNPDRVLESLDASIDQDTIEAAIMETDVILMVLVEGVHGVLRSWLVAEHQGYTRDAFAVSWE
jgi:hypothetical protein